MLLGGCVVPYLVFGPLGGLGFFCCASMLNFDYLIFVCELCRLLCLCFSYFLVSFCYTWYSKCVIYVALGFCHSMKWVVGSTGVYVGWLCPMCCISLV